MAWGLWGVICLNLRRASETERHQPQAGRFRARSRSPSSAAYRLRKLATPIALGPGESLPLQANVDGASWPSKEYATGIEADFGHLDFFPNHTVPTSRAKMAAPVRADIRMSRLERPKTSWTTNHTVTAATNATQRATRRSMILDIAWLCGAGDLISCDFAPMIWDTSPPLRISIRCDTPSWARHASRISGDKEASNGFSYPSWVDAPVLTLWCWPDRSYSRPFEETAAPS
jgi:hypothetical protein